MCQEFVPAGLTGNGQQQLVQRLVMTKRKQIAPERRCGREFLRAYNLLYVSKQEETTCSLNTNAPCEMCGIVFLDPL